MNRSKPDQRIPGERPTSERPEVIPVIVDVPRQHPGLGFERYVEAIAAAIRGGVPAQYTVGLYGPWGTGKSSILLSLQSKFANQKNVTAVVFDAWRHERTKNLLGPLLYTLKNAFDKQGTKSVAWTRIFGGMEFQAFGFGFRVPAEADRSEAAAGAVEAYMDAVDALVKLGKHLADDHRIVVMVDDLDRCSPNRVIEVVEAIRLLMDVPGFVFVLAIDYDVLISAVRSSYPQTDPHRFVEKIVQVPFRIPSIKTGSDGYLTDVVDGWSDLRSVWFDGVEDIEIQSIIGLALRDNPRQIKRMLNSYMVARHIDWEGIAGSRDKAGVLLASLALQLRWPEEFEELSADVRRYLRGPGVGVPGALLAAVPIYATWEKLSEIEDENALDFAEFLGNHLKRDLPLRIVDNALHVASDVAGLDDGPTALPQEVRARFLSRVLDLVGPSTETLTVVKSTTEARMSFQEEVIMKLVNIRSVPQTFEVHLKASYASVIEGRPVAASKNGLWTIALFAPTERVAVDDVLDHAAAMFGRLRAAVSGS